MDYFNYKIDTKKRDKHQDYIQQDLFNYWNAGIPESDLPLSPEEKPAPGYNANLYLDLFDPLFGLNKDQISLLQARENIIAVNSPPGTGKSAMLTTMAAYWIRQKKFLPREILILTLAGNEIPSLQSNLEAMLGNQCREVSLFTITDVAYNLLSESSRGMLKLYNRSERLCFLTLIFPFLGTREIQELSAYMENYGRNQGQLPEEEFEAMTESYLSSLQKIGAADLGTLVFQAYQQLIHNPGLLVRFKSRYKAILIDDFQDMDQGKYKFISLLINNDLANDDEQKQGRKVIVFNDHNQARLNLPAAENPLYHNFLAEFAENELGFHKNYRSQRYIVKSAKKLIKKYSHSRNLKYTSTRKQGEECKYYAAATAEEEAGFIVQTITQILHENSREIRPGEIGILYRHTSGTTGLIQAFERAGLPFYLPPPRPMIQSPPFSWIFSLFNFMLNRRDITSLADILLNTYPGFKMGDIQSIFLAGNRKEETLEMLIQRIYQAHQLSDQQFSQLTGLLKFIKKLQNTVLNSGITPALSLIITQFPALDPLATGFPLEFELLRQRAAAYDTDLRGFLKSFYLKADTLPEAEQDKYIQFLPCFKAKGSDFKVLFIPCLEEGTFPELTRVLEWEYRLFYLALTRAREQIFLSSAAQRNGKKTVPSSFLHELGATVLRVNPTQATLQATFSQQELHLS